MAAVNTAEDNAKAQLPGLLDTTYAGIRSHAPNAKVVVLDYPVFYDLSASMCVGLCPTSRAKIDEGIDLADGIIKTAATGPASPSPMCATRSPATRSVDGGSKWLHSLNFSNIGESYHPTADGHSGGYYPVFNSAAG